MTTATKNPPAVVTTPEEHQAAQQALDAAQQDLENAQEKVREATAARAEVEGRQRRTELGAVKNTIAADSGDTEPVTAAARQAIAALAELITLNGGRAQRLAGYARELAQLDVRELPPNTLAPQPDTEADLGLAWRRGSDGIMVRVGDKFLRPIPVRHLVHGVVAAAVQEAGLRLPAVNMQDLDAPRDFLADPDRWIADRW